MKSPFTSRPDRASFVRYKDKNELGVVGLISEDVAWCWFHQGGTKAAIDLSKIETLSIWQVLKGDFSNNYAKKSLMERHLRLWQNYGDVSDLIDDTNVRIEIFALIQKNHLFVEELKMGTTAYMQNIQPFIEAMHNAPFPAKK